MLHSKPLLSMVLEEEKWILDFTEVNQYSGSVSSTQKGTHHDKKNPKQTKQNKAKINTNEGHSKRHSN